jgi:hypothetical protein
MDAALELGYATEDVLRPEEVEGLRALHAHHRLRCHSCGTWIEPGETSTVALSADRNVAVAEFAHRRCAPSRTDLAALAIVSSGDPRGIAYVEALHPSAGAVLIWERTLDLRARGAGSGETQPYLEAHRATGFHAMLHEEPVRLLDAWTLSPEGDDLLLAHDGATAERFTGAFARPAAGWLEAARASGHCLLLVGTGLGLGTPAAHHIQAAMRSGRAVMGLAEFRDH